MLHCKFNESSKNIFCIKYLSRFEAADCCDRVNYCKVMEFLDYVKHPALKANPTHIAVLLLLLPHKYMKGCS